MPTTLLPVVLVSIFGPCRRVHQADCADFCADKCAEFANGWASLHAPCPDRSQFQGDEAYRFRHLLIRDAAYAALPKTVRARLHEHFAEWLEEHGTELVGLDGLVGYHLEQTAKYKQELGNRDRALELRAGERLALAGRHAAWRRDTDAVKGLLERALVLLRSHRLDVYLELDLANLQPTEAGALDVVEEAAGRAHAAQDRRAEAVARSEAARRRVALGAGTTVDEQEALAQEAIRLLDEVGDHEGLVHAYVVLGQACNHRAQYEAYAQACELALYHARQIGRPGLFQLPAALVHGPRPADKALRMLDQ